MSASTLPTELRVWCHACESFGQAALNAISCEYECTTCHSDCVEKDNQGIEDFQENQPSSSEDNSADTNVLVQQVMDRILGLNTPLGAYQAISVGGQARRGRVRQRPDDLPGGVAPGQPVPAVRQIPMTSFQLLGDGDMSQLGGFMSVPVSNDPGSAGVGVQASHQSVFGLLSSLNSMRARPAMFSTSWGGLDAQMDEANSNQWEEFLHHILMNESSRAGAPPASKQVLDDLPRHTIADQAEVASYGECNITQEEFEVGEVMIALPCGHNYKQEPILHWLEMHNTCPVCRLEVKKPAEAS